MKLRYCARRAQWLAKHRWRAGAAVWVAVMMGASLAVAASAGALSPAEISDFKATLVKARHAQVGMKECVAGLDGHVAQAVAQRDARQVRLGELRTREEALRAEIATQEAALAGYGDELRREEETLHRLQADLRSLQQRKDAQEAELRACKSHWYSVDWVCDAASGIAHVVGAFKDVSGDIGIAERRVNAAHAGLRQAEQRRDEARAMLEKAAADARAVDAELGQTERELVRLHATLATVRADVQAYKTLLDDFEHALAESEKLDTEDGRARTVRRLRDIAARIESSLARSAQAVATANSSLAEGAFRCSMAWASKARPINPK